MPATLGTKTAKIPSRNSKTCIINDRDIPTLKKFVKILGFICFLETVKCSDIKKIYFKSFEWFEKLGIFWHLLVIV